MENKLNIALVQSPLVWEDADANLSHFSKHLESLHEDVGLIVLPEMFSTGFTMVPQLVAEKMDGKTVAWMREMASDKNCAITGSVVIEEDGKFYNRLLFVIPSGDIQTYDKRHLFSLAGEDKTYTAGKERLVVNYSGFKICLLICYDLRFPAFSRNTEDYDLLIYVANWPQTRITAWDTLLKARAIENMSYVVGVNRIGEDGSGHEYPGHSKALDYFGEYLVSAGESEGVFITTIDKETLYEIREKLGFLNDRDQVRVD